MKPEYFLATSIHSRMVSLLRRKEQSAAAAENERMMAGKEARSVKTNSAGRVRATRRCALGDLQL